MKDEKLKYFGGSQKHLSFRGVLEKPIYRGDCLKSWALDNRFKGGGLGKKERVVPLRRGDTPVHTMMKLWDVY